MAQFDKRSMESMAFAAPRIKHGMPWGCPEEDKAPAATFKATGCCVRRVGRGVCCYLSPRAKTAAAAKQALAYPVQISQCTPCNDVVLEGPKLCNNYNSIF